MSPRRISPILPLFFFAFIAASQIASPIVSSVNAAQAGSQSGPDSAPHYACRMHPLVTSSKPGKCPQCGMALQLKDDGAAGAARPEHSAEPDAGGLAALSSRIPDTRVYDQNSDLRVFYKDLVKGQTVAINFIFTTCTTICPPMTATFRRIQQDLAKRGVDVHLISISVDPATDTPERLREFARRFGAGAGWTFVTGETNGIESLLKVLGAAVADKNNHSPLILIGNEPAGYWMRADGLSSPTALEKLIIEAAARK